MASKRTNSLRACPHCDRWKYGARRGNQEYCLSCGYPNHFKSGRGLPLTAHEMSSVERLLTATNKFLFDKKRKEFLESVKEFDNI